MKKQSEEIVISGSTISEGIAIGKLFLLSSGEEIMVPQFAIQETEVDSEIERYRDALSSSRIDLKKLQTFLTDEGSDEAVTIIDAHIQMLEDPLMTTHVEEKISQMLQNTESVFRSVIGEYEEKFEKIEDTFFHQRLIDVKDLSHRILKHLHPKEEEEVIPANAVVFAKELVPSHTAEACVSKVCAFISEIGGATSHAALIARAKGLPYVANIKEADIKEIEGCLVIVDGIDGKVILNPNIDTQEKYTRLQNSILESVQRKVASLPKETITLDGQKIVMAANIEGISDFDHPYFGAAEEIGLFRSEFLFLKKEIFATSEEEQHSLYHKIFDRAGDMPIVFRVLDIGGDKGFFQDAMQDEPNPALGCRAIRFLLKNKELFTRQLKALLRAAQGKKASILIPLVTDVSEVIEVKTLLNDIKEEFDAKRIPYAKEVPIGLMIEVPSAVLTADALAKECDFFSIGTNDLVQYTLALDRTNPMLSEHYHPAHPSILKLLKMVIDVAKKHHKKLSICGEMASNPLYTKLLLGLGVKNFSCAPRHIPKVQSKLLELNSEEAAVFARKVLKLEQFNEIEKALREDLID
ncbi:phosphoenolpyruvate--protein phosphotransferase [Candidatus Aerophobetes bacterium]|uniref:Phosphoenolpyruvate-protein phosphotransferase n=1 Tax=Aerophobetes bacterium TaxID=2030807 RepID=A0A2A4YL66_UNCAE|nr:MAG: phosphoenolpyruvate--protein phosphotransferase [Candidatus Aerophobetes bacterium]